MDQAVGMLMMLMMLMLMLMLNWRLLMLEAHVLTFCFAIAA